MTAEILQMSVQEQSRSEVIRLYIEGHIKQKEAARRISLSCRQVRRLAKRYKQDGAKGLIHRSRGKESNRKLSAAFKAQVIGLVRKHYWDFGPTFAVEKLCERDGLNISSETLRHWMINEGLWKSRSKKKKANHPIRERRPCIGELIQIDGSPHDWFEGRSGKCTLIVFIDDATSKLMDIHFYPTEGTQAYMEGLRRYMSQYGRPAALYSDRHSTFVVNQVDAKSGEQITQFGRALKTLDIQHIPANSPQAKGRVERSNLTLQDRLVKEMRLAGVSSMEEGNAFLAKYMQKHNQKFAVKAISDKDAHRDVIHSEEELNLIFSRHYKRKVSSNLAVQYNNTTYQINIKNIGYAMRGSTITICEEFNGKVTLLYKGKSQKYTAFKRGEKVQQPVSDKTINHVVDQTIRNQNKRQHYKPSIDHPWRRNAIGSSTKKRTVLFWGKEDISTLR